MIISRSKNFVFIHLEKCGGTSVEFALEPYLAPEDIILGSTEFGTALQIAYMKRYGKDFIAKNFLSKHSTAHDAKRYLGSDYDNMYKFAIVRNPAELMTSLYFYSKKIVDVYLSSENIQSEQLLDWTIHKMPEHWKNMEVFLLNYTLSEIDQSGIDGFVRRMVKSGHGASSPQLWRLDSSVEIFDLGFIEDEWPLILEKIGVKEEVILEKHNSSKRNKNVQLSADSMKMIKKHFKVDYEWIPKKIRTNWDG